MTTLDNFGQLLKPFDLSALYALYTEQLLRPCCRACFCGTPPFCLKVVWWVGGCGGGLQHFIVSPWPLGFRFGTKGFGTKGFGAKGRKKLFL